MPIAPRTALAAALVIGLAAPASAASVDDLLNLRANGLSEDLLVALVQTDGSSFDLSPDDVLALHQKGLGDRLIGAMLKTAPRRPDGPRARHDARPSTSIPDGRPVAVGSASAIAVAAAPVVVAVSSNAADAPAAVVAVPTVVVIAPAVPAAPYWGFGGRPRPGSWIPR